MHECSSTTAANPASECRDLPDWSRPLIAYGPLATRVPAVTIRAEGRMRRTMIPPPSYLDELDEMLLEQSDDCMLLSQLNGFLTAIAVGPELIPPSRWLKQVWCGDD